MRVHPQGRRSAITPFCSRIYKYIERGCQFERRCGFPHRRFLLTLTVGVDLTRELTLVELLAVFGVAIS